MTLQQKLLDCRSFTITETVRIGCTQHPGHITPFWTGTFKANIDGKVKIVKAYYKTAGGKYAFERHLDSLSRNA